jgi:3'-5' exoribonuclease-like protein
MNYFKDFEFNEDGRVIEPISLGMVCEDGRELYMEFQFDEDKVRETNPWVRDNVLPLLTWPKNKRVDFEEARIQLYNFIGSDRHTEVSPIFWGYFCDYDWVCFCRIYGKMVDLPSHFPKYCMDLQQYYKQLGSPSGVKPPKAKSEHNSLVDARWNRQFYRSLEQFRKKAPLFSQARALGEPVPSDHFRSALQMTYDLGSDATDEEIVQSAANVGIFRDEIRHIFNINEDLTDEQMLERLRLYKKYSCVPSDGDAV